MDDDETILEKIKRKAAGKREVRVAYPGALPSKRKLSGRKQQGRGRPKGSYKYVIPGVGPVDIFTYKNWLNKQRKLERQQFTRQLIVQKARNQAIRNVYPNRAEQIIQQQSSLYQPNFQSVPPVQPSLKEISIIERTPLNLGSNPNGEFIERDLFSGQPKIRRRGTLM